MAYNVKTPAEIITFIMENEGETQDSLGAICNVTGQTFSEIQRGKTKTVSKKIATALCERFPKYSYTWLRTGQGSPFKQDELSYTGLYPVPIVSSFAQAGYLQGFDNDQYLDNLPKTYVPKNLDSPKISIAFFISGDSMDNNTSDSILDGDMVLCDDVTEYITSNNRTIGKYSYIIVHNEGIVCKKISNIDEINGKLTLHSNNPMYKDYEVRASDIRRIFRIVRINRTFA